MQDDQLLELIAAVYDAALESERWPEALRRIGASMAGSSGILAVHPMSGGVQWAMIAGLDPASLPTYADDFSSADTNPYFQMCQRVALGEPIPAENISAPVAVEQTEFYRTILAPQRLHYSVVLTLLRDESRVAAAAFLRSAIAGPFGQEELALLRALAPHLQRALKLTLRNEQLHAQSQSLAEALNVSATGTLLTDAHGQVIFVNPAGRRVLKEGDGLSIRKGGLAVHDASARKALTAAIAMASRGQASDDADFEAATALIVPRQSGRQAYNLLVWPLRVTPGVMPVDLPSALIFMTDPVTGARPPLETVAAIYGFTPSETALASLLVEGLTLKEAADRLDITMNTVKTHVKQLFAKTNTRRQADLIRLALQFPPLAPR
jgi:DNA-binding CsgD family transcriptional regulator